MVELIGRYGCGLRPPSYHEIRETYLKKEVAHTLDILEENRVEWKKTGCSIMSDGWTDRKRRSICNFLVNSSKGTVFLSSVDTSDISKTSEKVFEMLDSIVEQVGEENVVQVITDNAANYKAAGGLLMEKRKRLYWTPCAAHCIDLMLEDFEKNLAIHKSTIAKGRKITTFIYSRTMLISMLRHNTNQRDLIRPGATRFATAYLTLNSLSDLKVCLIKMSNSKQWKTSRFAGLSDGKKVEKTVLKGNFWTNVKACLKAACPLIKVLRLVDSEETPAMGFIYEAMDRAKTQIQMNFNNLKRRYEPIWKIIDARWELQLHRPLHAAAYYLNPQFHYSPEFKCNSSVKLGLYSCIQRMIPDASERNDIDMQLESFKEAKGLFGIEATKNARDRKPPAVWWDAYGDDCPELKRFAIRVLSLTCSSSGCERNWSSFEMVHTKRRNRLRQKKMNDLVFVMYNLKLFNGRKSRQRNEEQFNADELPSDHEWIIDEDEPQDASALTSLGGNDAPPPRQVRSLGKKIIESDAFEASSEDDLEHNEGDENNMGDDGSHDSDGGTEYDKAGYDSDTDDGDSGDENIDEDDDTDREPKDFY